MKCYNCGHLLPEDSEFCQYCGKKIETEISIQENAVEEVIVADETTETAEIDLSDLENATPDEALDTIIKIQAEGTVKNLDENKKEKRVKNRFCKFCGGQIDAQTKKCGGCGKQYFKGIKFNKFLTTVLVLLLVIITVVTLNIVQFIKINEINEDIERYEEKISNFEKEIEEKDEALKRYKNYYEQDTSYTGLEKINKLFGLD